jgi:CrcB protein
VTRFLLVCAGGAVGSGLRYGVAVWAAARFGGTFPAGTLIVNLLGSFAIAVVMELSAETSWLSPDLRILLTTGLMGGFTTYSAFNYETTQYLRSGTWGIALLNIAATILGCLLAGAAGIAAARLMIR